MAGGSTTDAKVGGRETGGCSGRPGGQLTMDSR